MLISRDLQATCERYTHRYKGLSDCFGQITHMASPPGSQTFSDTTSSVLYFTRYAYPLILLIFFIVIFIVRDIVNAPPRLTANVPGSPQKSGPGGRPLPSPAASRPSNTQSFTPTRARSVVLQCLASAVALSFVADATTVVLHVLTERARGWWCGEAVVVSPLVTVMIQSLTSHHRSTL